jgi:hypothetical protein
MPKQKMKNTDLTEPILLEYLSFSLRVLFIRIVLRGLEDGTLLSETVKSDH